MAESVTIARPYAEALFKVAKENGSLAAWSDRLALLAQVAANPEVHAAIGHPNVGVSQLVEFFKAASGTAVEAEVSNFIQLLAENDRLSCLPEIAHLFETYKQREEGTQEAEIVSAFALSDEQIKSLTPQLEAYFKTSLKSSVTVDPELIGGIKVVVGDRVLDVSVRGKLNAMATALNN